MEKLFYQHEYHNIPFRELKGEKDESRVVGREFYSTFYQALISRTTEASPKWIEHKRKIGKLLAGRILSTSSPQEQLRVFSVGAGLGIVEDELCSYGFACDALECEPYSLSWLKKSFPQVRVLVGDGMNLPCRSEVYDLVFMSAADYCFDRMQYEQVLGEMRRIVKPDGRVVCVCVSNLSLKSFIRGTLKKALINAWNRPHPVEGEVAWGYQRTIGEHLSVGRKAGLECKQVYLMDQDFNVQSIRKPTVRYMSWPTLRDHHVVVVFKRATL
jgi:SAM-dependent methyltransferase